MIDIKEATDKQLKAELDRREAERLEKEKQENEKFNKSLEAFLQNTPTFKDYKIDKVSELISTYWLQGGGRRTIQIDLVKKDDN